MCARRALDWFTFYIILMVQSGSENFNCVCHGREESRDHSKSKRSRLTRPEKHTKQGRAVLSGIDLASHRTFEKSKGLEASNISLSDVFWCFFFFLQMLWDQSLQSENWKFNHRGHCLSEEHIPSQLTWKAVSQCYLKIRQHRKAGKHGLQRCINTEVLFNILSRILLRFVKTTLKLYRLQEAVGFDYTSSRGTCQCHWNFSSELSEPVTGHQSADSELTCVLSVMPQLSDLLYLWSESKQ